MVEWGPVGGFHFFWILGMFALLFVVAVPVLIIWAVRATSHPAFPVGAPPMPPTSAPPTQPAAQRETPLEILARRFASGEISAEEYQRARDLLGGDKT
jgi:uncharacterized membrane protein